MRVKWIETPVFRGAGKIGRYNRAGVVKETGPGLKGGGKVLVIGGQSGVRIDRKGN